MPEGCVASVVGARVHAGLWFPSPNRPPASADTGHPGWFPRQGPQELA